MRGKRFVLTALGVVFATAFAGAEPATAPGPLSAEQAALFRASPEDKLDKLPCEPGSDKRATSKCMDAYNYVHTNEAHHELFVPYLAGLRGGYLGVGADQGLTLVAAARSELAWFLDYDPVVVAMNRVIQTFLEEAPTPEAYRAFWDKAQRPQSLVLLARKFKGDRDRKLITGTFRKYQSRMRSYLRRIDGGKKGTPRHHFLHDAGDYAYVRALAQAGRIRVMKGDLLKSRAVRGAGAAASALKVPIQVFYLSNADSFWGYSSAFKKNVEALPMSDRSVILRTILNDFYQPQIDGEIYVIQRGLDFQQRLKGTGHGHLSKMMNDRKLVKDGVFTIAMP